MASARRRERGARLAPRWHARCVCPARPAQTRSLESPRHSIVKRAPFCVAHASPMGTGEQPSALTSRGIRSSVPRTAAQRGEAFLAHSRYMRDTEERRQRRRANERWNRRRCVRLFLARQRIWCDRVTRLMPDIQSIRQARSKASHDGSVRWASVCPTPRRVCVST